MLETRVILMGSSRRLVMLWDLLLWLRCRLELIVLDGVRSFSSSETKLFGATLMPH